MITGERPPVKAGLRYSTPQDLWPEVTGDTDTDWPRAAHGPALHLPASPDGGADREDPRDAFLGHDHLSPETP